MQRSDGALQPDSADVRRIRGGRARHFRRQRLVSPGVRESRHLRFPLLADFEPKGEVARRYGAYDKQGFAESARRVEGEEIADDNATRPRRRCRSCARFSRCTGYADHFWEFHDALFENQSRLGADLYAAIVAKVGLDVAQLQAALEADEYLESVRADFNGGVRSGVNGTPTFFVNGARYEGSPDVETMAEALDRAVRARRRRSEPRSGKTSAAGTAVYKESCYVTLHARASTRGFLTDVRRDLG